MHVLVIGGGTGGMCLAHGLKRAGRGVSVAVYERHGSRSDGLYGYRVGIDPTGNRALHDWHPNLRRIFELSDPEAAFPLRIATSVPVEPWQSTNITLLGDAIHTMTPGQGVGANTALRDAALLCHELTAAARGEKSPLAAVADYEAEMIPYGFARVAESLGNNGTSGDDPLYRPVLGRLALFGARTYFSAAGRIPLLRRKFLDDLYTYRGADDPAAAHW